MTPVAERETLLHVAKGLQDGPASAESDLAALESRARRLLLAREVLAAARPKPPRWPAALTVAASFLSAAYLVFTPVASVDIAISLNSSALRVQPATDGPALNALSLREVTAVGGSSLRLWPAAARTKAAKVTDVGAQPLALTRVRIAGGSITAQPFGLAQRGDLALEVNRAGSALLLTTRRAAEPPQFSGYGKLATFADSGASTADLEIPTGIELQGEVEEFAWQVTPLETGAVELIRAMPIRGADFTILDERPDEERFVTHATSAINAGTLVVRLGEHSYDLLPGDRLELANFTGILREVTFKSGALDVRIDGRAEDVRLGPGLRTVVPSRLEGLHEREGAKLVWVSAVWLCGVLFTLSRWWRN